MIEALLLVYVPPERDLEPACGRHLGASRGPAGPGGRSRREAASGPFSGPFSGPVSGKPSTFGFSLQDEIATVRVDAFKQANPSAQLKVNEGGFDEQQFLSAVAAGTPPDVVYLSRETIGSYAARGALLPMNDCIDQRGIDMGQFRQPALDQLRYKDNYYGIPEFFNSPVIILNDAVLQQAGVLPDQVDVSNQAKMLEVAQKMTVREGDKITRLGFDFHVPDLMPLYGVVDGHPFISGPTSIELNHPKTVTTYQRLKELEDAQGGFKNVKEFTDTWDFFGEKNQFVRGQVGGMVIEQWYLNVLAGTSPKLALTVKPITDVTGKPVTWSTGSAWAIPRGSKNPAAACELAKVMTAAPTWEAAVKVRVNKRLKEKKVFTGTYTANKMADDVIFNSLFKPQGGAFKAYEDGVQTVLSVQDGAWTVPATAVGAQFKSAWQSAATRVLLGQQSAEEALARAQKEVDAALAKAAK